MGWQDRDYGRDGGDGGGRQFALAQLAQYSLPIGTYLNIRVAIHWSFFLVLLGHMLTSKDVWWTLRWAAMLFISVLLHEFGHCLACRKVGGRADDILMWPLGGLAYCEPPHSPWAHFMTVVWGPLVNVIIAAACYSALLATHAANMPVSFHPFRMWQGYVPGLPGVLADLFVVNYSLLLFNLALLFYPFDGGRLVQIALWKKLGFAKSMRIALRIGMGGAIAVALYGIVAREFMIIFIAFFGFFTCYQQSVMYAQQEPRGFGRAMTGVHYSPEFDGPPEDEEPREQKIGWFKRMRMRAAARRKAAERAAQEALDAEVDRILAKVKDQGLQSLTDKEKKTLKHATERQRRVG